MTETRLNEKSTYRIRRVISSTEFEGSDREDVWRPIGSQRFTASENFRVKDQDGKALRPEAYAWIVKKFVEANGTTMTKRGLRDGLLAEIKVHEEATVTRMDKQALSFEKSDS